jgi:hypothetical protein
MRGAYAPLIELANVNRVRPRYGGNLPLTAPHPPPKAAEHPAVFTLPEFRVAGGGAGMAESTIGERIRELRRPTFTQTDLAAAADVSVDGVTSKNRSHLRGGCGYRSIRGTCRCQPQPPERASCATAAG